ncbi:radical SAM domain-containing protein [[Clostridium] sordellii]|uniref:radical SAM/SPASM domain-containing protein n=1 Tax=Paraclostridium sordellii TaxID=1505 RepID=UPI0005E38457|nr:radical SAM protein [Paeniclostridium sordellii]CEP45498.1 radical SAM domain-containing protein [[Clostridium] sordellii] [Paeniclostridium sordellii]
MNCTVWTTKNCNLSCKYCYEHENKETGNMSLYIENKTLDNIKNMIRESDDNIHNIQFHGGEPLLNFNLIKRFVEEIEKIKGNSTVKYTLTTNGTIWNPEIESFFRKYKDSFSGYISISLDGDCKTHNKNRVYKNNEGSFDKVLKTSKDMKSIFKWLRCRVTVSPNTVESLFDNVKYLIELGFKQISVAFDFFSIQWNEKHIDIIDVQYNKILKYWEENSLKVEISLVDEVIRPREVLGVCSPSKHFYIDGLIYPCTFVVGLKEYSIGNIESGIDTKRVEDIIKISSVDNNECKRCNNKKTCSSNRCKLINKVITGDFYTPPTIKCVLENIQIKNMNKLRFS